MGSLSFRRHSQHKPSMQSLEHAGGHDPPSLQQKYDFPQCHMPEISHLSAKELRRLVSDEVYFFDYFQTLKPIQDYHALQNAILVDSEQIAKDNLMLGRETSRLKRQHHQTETELKSTIEKYERLHGKQEAFHESFGISACIEKLKGELSDLEKKGEVVVNALLNNEIDIDKFISAYKENRAKAHLAMIALEKLSRLYHLPSPC